MVVTTSMRYKKCKNSKKSRIVLDILVPISGERWTKTFELKQASMNLKKQFGESKFQMCWMEPAAVMLA